MTQPTTVWGLLEAGLAASPDGVAYVGSSGAPVDYRTFHRTAAWLASALRAAGIGRGDAVVILERNTPEFMVWTFAAAGVGAMLVPVNLRLAPAEVAGIVRDAAPALIVLAEEFEPLLAELDDGVPRALLHAEGAPLGLALRPSASGDAFLPAPVEPADVAHLYYTSGTTGAPKGVPLTHRNVVSHALAATSELDLASDDVWGHFAPMFHLADAWAVLAVTAVGGVHAFLPAFEERAALALMEDAGVTVTNLVPVMLQRMLKVAPEAGFDGGSLRLVLSGGAPIAPATVRAVLDTFRCEYVQTYGLTETSPYLTLSTLEPRHRALPEEQQLARRARTGRPFETVELRVVDEDGRDVPRDDRAVGEIIARGSSVTPGYRGRPEETAAAFRDGWFHTGDLATIDAEGWVNIVDRKKDVIVTGGENVYSIEVENALYEHPAVLECAAYGAPSERWGEEVRAAVVLRGEASPDELVEHVRGRIAAYKVPRRLTIRPELPKTGSGKIAKRRLLETEPG